MSDDPTFATSYGTPVAYPHATQRVTNNDANGNGVVLLQDLPYIESLAHFARERIPERIVHAKGAGAHGQFTVTVDPETMGKYTSSPFLLSKGTTDATIDATVRFSTVTGEMGSADTIRNPRGFAIKLRTLQGIWDLVLLNSPVFCIRDPAKFPDLVHIIKRNPQTNVIDPDMQWDFLSSNPETIHGVMYLYSDEGTPNGYYSTNGFSVNTFVLSKDDGAYYYARFYAYFNGSSEMPRTLSDSEAMTLAGTNPDYGTAQLFKAIEGGTESITYSIQVQVLDPQNLSGVPFNPLDATKDWLLDTSGSFTPPFEIGTLVLNQNPLNYFDEVEQLAFAPSHLIPFIEPSPDPILQGRLFAYPDAQRYRLGVNNQQLPINQPPATLSYANFLRAGKMSIISQKNRANYQAFANPPGVSFYPATGFIDSQINNNTRHEEFNGSPYRFLSRISLDDFVQPATVWGKWTSDQQTAFVNNITSQYGGSLRNVLNQQIQQNQLLVLACVSTDLASRVASELGVSYTPSSPQDSFDALIRNLENYRG